MGRQVIKQPDGLYAVFSTGTDRWVAYDLTREQYIERRAEQAAAEARTDAVRLLDEVDRGEVSPLGYAFAEANAESVEHGGKDLSGKLAKQEPDWEKIRAYGRGETRGEELTEEEMDLAGDGLDALGWDLS